MNSEQRFARFRATLAAGELAWAELRQPARTYHPVAGPSPAELRTRAEVIAAGAPEGDTPVCRQSVDDGRSGRLSIRLTRWLARVDPEVLIRIPPSWLIAADEQMVGWLRVSYARARRLHQHALEVCAGDRDEVLLHRRALPAAAVLALALMRPSAICTMPPDRAADLGIDIDDLYSLEKVWARRMVASARACIKEWEPERLQA